MSIRRRGERSWQVTVWLGRDANGKPRRRFIHVEGTKRDALKAERDALAEIERGTDVDPTRLTVGGLLDQWVRDYVKINTRPSTQRRYVSIVKRLKSHAIANVRAQALRPPAVQSLYTDLLSDGLSSRTVHHYHRLLSECLSWGVRLQVLSTNACDGVTPPRPEEKEVRALSPEEIAVLLDEVPDGDLHRLVRVALGTGARLGELLGLKWGDLSDGQIRIERAVTWERGRGWFYQPPKTRAGRRSVRLAASTIEALRLQRVAQNERRLLLGPAWIDDDVIFDRGDGGIWSPNAVSKQFTAAARAAGFEGTTFHHLRHSHATLLLRGGIDVKLAAARLGHASPVITMTTYQHIAADLEQRVADVVDKLLEGDRH